MDDVLVIALLGASALAVPVSGTMWWRERAARKAAQQAHFEDAVHSGGKYLLLEMRLARRERRIRELAEEVRGATRRADGVSSRLALSRAYVAELRSSLRLALQAFGRQADEAAELARAWGQEAGRRHAVEVELEAALAVARAVEDPAEALTALGVVVRWDEDADAFVLSCAPCGRQLCAVVDGDGMDVLVGVALAHGGSECSPVDAEAVAS